MLIRSFAYLLCMAGAVWTAAAQNAEFQAVHSHFERGMNARFENLFRGISGRAQWEPRQSSTRAALEKMLWGDLRLPSTAPPASVTGRQERREYILENLVIETAPKIYLTANLYLPRTGAKPYPVVVYQCGHASKRYYAKHGAWFAAHGIAALVMDNIEMGEIEFTHHGVYASAWFHWYSRGFSPLAAELLNARRAVDYLCTRPDIDRKRIGATGRSGGGMTTFFLAAIDERITASAPVSGTLSTRGWIQHRLSMAHCDCQNPVNSYALMYEEIGALVAPRAQLLCNADADRGFPMDSFNEMADKMREIYRLYGAEQALGTAVAPGGHADTEAIRLPVFNFFLKEFLGATTPLTAEGPIDAPPDQDLVCFREGLPVDERLTRIDEELLPPRTRPTSAASLAATLRQEVFRYFPKQPAALETAWEAPSTAQGRTARKVTFTSFDGLRVRAVYSLPASSSGRKLPALLLVDNRKGIPVWGNEQPLERNQWGERAVLVVETLDRGGRALEQNLRSFSDDDLLHHLRREAMVAGTTLESMQVYEVLRSLELLRTLPEVDAAAITITGKGEAGINGMYAALLDEHVARVVMGSPTGSHRQGPHYLDILRYTDIPETTAVLGGKVRIYGELPPGMPGPARSSLIECLR